MKQVSHTRRRQQLHNYQRQYQRLLEQVAQIGPVKKGTLSEVYNECSSKGCRCHRGKQYRHGPYWQWTSQVNGRSRCHMVKGKELQLYRAHTANNKKLLALLKQLYELSDNILNAELVLGAPDAIDPSGAELAPGRRRPRRADADPR